MLPDAELSNWIIEAIKRLTTEESTEPAWSKAYAELYNLLPLMHGWTASFGLRADGKVLFYTTDDEEQTIREEADERLRNMAMYRGSLKYPELSVLVPNRPANAMICSFCEGRGRIELEGIDPNVIVCYCGGLGWLPHGTQIPTG